MNKRVMLRVVLLCLLTLPPCWGAERVLLRTGFSLSADRHEIEGATVRLWQGAASTELPLAAVASIEPFFETAAPPATLAAPRTDLPDDPRELVRQAAERYGLPPWLLHSVASLESGYRQDAVSPKGAVGIMQLMPQTARELGADPSDAGQNVDAGARYLRGLLLKYLDDPFQLRKALAAYNAGPAAVDRYSGVPPYPETQRYVRRILRQVRPHLD